MWALFESPPGPLFMSGLGPLARYGTGVSHYHMWLNMFIKFVENNVPINQEERTCEANPAGENSSLIFAVCVKSVPLYHFKPDCALCYFILMLTSFR